MGSNMKTVPITKDLKVLADILGGFRSIVARNANVKDAKIGPQSGIDGDKDGILGELGFCRLMNVWPDIGLSPRSGSHDAVVGGNRIDVKTTRHKTGRLLATLKENPDVDIYVLAIIEDAEVKFPGFARKEDLINESNITDLGHGPGYAMTQDKLRRFQ